MSLKLDWFEPITLEAGTILFACVRCGALVWSAEQHQAHHEMKDLGLNL